MKFAFAGILSALALGLGACGDEKSSTAPEEQPLGGLSSDSEESLSSSSAGYSAGSIVPSVSSSSVEGTSEGASAGSSEASSSSAADSMASSSGSVADTIAVVAKPPVVFTEVDVVNLSYKDEEGGDAGWVEVYNPADTAVNLKGFYLTNTLSDPAKFKFGDVVVKAKSHMIVYLSGRNLPDFVAPHDTTDLLSSYCETESDAVSYAGRGNSEIKPLPGQSDFCFVENGANRAGAQYIPVKGTLGYYVLALTIGATEKGATDKEKVPVDLSNVNMFQMRAYIPEGHSINFKLTQKGFRDVKGWTKILEGTGDSNTVYSIRPTLHTDYPNMAQITGVRLDIDNHDSIAKNIKVFSYIAYSRGHEPHANFKSKKEGGSLYLFNGEKQLVDSVMYPAAVIGKTWSLEVATGAGSDGAKRWGFAAATPYGATAGAVENAASQNAKTEFPNSGFYSKAFSIAFGSADDYRCEKGGTVPTATSPLMAAELKIDTTTVLRCATFTDGAVPGNVINRTYIFEEQPTVASVFITGDPLQMFHADSGLFKNENFWGDKEIPVNIELLEPGKTAPGFSENAGLAMSGNATRTWAKKSVEITFREKYGKNKLDYALFPEFPNLKKFKSFKLRNNGNNFHFDYIRDMLASSITEGLGVDYQHGRASIVFYNGEYYGIHNIRESSNKNYYLANYNLDGDQIDLLISSGDVATGSPVDFRDLTNLLLTSKMTDEDLEKINEQLDLNNLINYYAAEIFADNRDWPGNNRKIWRSKNPKTAWKWFMFDTDMAFDNTQSKLTGNIFEFVTAENSGWPNNPEFTLHLRMLLKNENFKAAFINQIATTLCMNFSSERVVARMNKLQGDISAEIARDQKRWSKNVATMTEHEGRIKTFATTRQDVVRSEMQEHFALGEMVDVTLASSGNGTVQVHYLPLDKSSQKIKFFKGTPVTLTAVPKDGAMFTGWSDGIKDATRTIDPTDGLKVTANFK
ncbi:CotH kinase family protein [Fibrobacter sp. UWEL]|uniref:CotH kinase family protein n=1 Tax=Fibrobacter sp. UWEL TaxID=1896209 RepID=UPI0013566EA8|nr:CotH kinase family protein [Fibrobacter sp. UWEL]